MVLGPCLRFRPSGPQAVFLFTVECGEQVSEMDALPPFLAHVGASGRYKRSESSLEKDRASSSSHSFLLLHRISIDLGI